MTNGQPMTEEQLKKKIGDPIWVESARRAEWMILWGYNPPEVYGRAFIFTRRTAQKEMFPFSELGVTWRAYAYHTAHIDRSEWTAEWVKYDGYTACSNCEYWYDSPESEDEGDRPAFCPSCGRAMTPEAWADLENRLMG